MTSWTVAGQAPLSMRILQARILEWVAMSSSRGSSQPRDQTYQLLALQNPAQLLSWGYRVSGQPLVNDWAQWRMYGLAAPAHQNSFKGKNLCSRTPCWVAEALSEMHYGLRCSLTQIASSPLIFPFRHLQIHKPHALSAASQSLLPGGPKWHKCDSSMLSWHWS